MRRTRSTLTLGTALAVAIAAAAPSAGAQGLSSASARLAPQYVSYQLTQGGSKSTVSELAVPFAFAIPLTSRLTFDVATAYASAMVDGGGAKSTISGFTDTQVRFNLTFGADALVVTAGLNAPSGQYEVKEDKIAAAGNIGNDFFAFPVSSFGNGLAGTGGIALARAIGEWNLGLGASFRKSAEFGAYQTSSDVLHFTPADEMRLRAGVDHSLGDGRVMLGVVFSQFGKDATDDGTSQTTYSTGDRIIGQAAVELPVGERQLYVGGWYLHHAAGEQVTGEAPPENIMNVLAALSMNAGSVFLEPSVEARFWQIDGARAGLLTYAGLRTKFQLSSFELSPSFAYGFGSTEGAAKTDVSGIKGGLTIKLVR